MEVVEKQRQILTRKRSLIVEWLDPDDVVDELIQSSLVGPSAAQQLQLNKTQQEKNRIIVEQLSKGGPGTLVQFCEILRSRKRQVYIAEELETECHGKLDASYEQSIARAFEHFALWRELHLAFLQRYAETKRFRFGTDRLHVPSRNGFRGPHCVFD